MGQFFQTLLNKIDYRLSRYAHSRPQYQVSLLVQALKKYPHDHFKSLLDVGGGFADAYRHELQNLAGNYRNLDIRKGKGVDIVGSVYKIPVKSKSVDVVSLFMVLEHLNEPKQGLKECSRILGRHGYLLLTTVQYWHTHNHPNDYFRYTKSGLHYLCKESGFRIIKIWSHGGPILVLFHVIELNLVGIGRSVFSIVAYPLANLFDWIVFRHEDTRKHSDSVGWSLIAQKI